MNVTLSVVMKTQCILCFSDKNILIFTKNKYNIYKCTNCEFVFVFPAPSETDMLKMYENFDYSNPLVAEKAIRDDAVRSIKKIERSFSDCGLFEKTLLDIGCGRGYFLDEARGRGWKVRGTDYSNKTISYAKKTLQLDVVGEDINREKEIGNYYVVCLNQVIEHFSNPFKVIQHASRKLKQNGLLYIATPNIDSLSALVNKENFDYLIPPEHLIYFNKKTLVSVLEKSGLQVIYIGGWGYKEEFAGLVKKYIKSLFRLNISNINNKVEFKQRKEKNSQFIKEIIKYNIYDRLFAGIFYKVLYFNTFGSMIEVVAQKSS